MNYRLMQFYVSVCRSHAHQAKQSMAPILVLQSLNEDWRDVQGVIKTVFQVNWTWKIRTQSLCKCQPQIAATVMDALKKPQAISLIRYCVFQWVVYSWAKMFMRQTCAIKEAPLCEWMVGGLWCFIWLGFPTWLDIKQLVYHASWCA